MRAKILIMVTSLFVLLSGLTTTALARPRGGAGFGGRSYGFRGGFYGVYPRYYFWGPAYPYWGRYPGYAGPGSVEVYRVNYGTIEFKVKPESSRVFVDQHFLGTVEELNGRHHEAYLPGGYHDIKVVAPDGRIVERTLYAAVGRKIKFECRF